MKLCFGKSIIECIITSDGKGHYVAINGLVIMVKDKIFYCIGFPIFWTE